MCCNNNYNSTIIVELKQHYDEQVKEMEGKHHRELTQIRDDHKVEINRMQRALEVVSHSFLTLNLCNHLATLDESCMTSSCSFKQSIN